MSALIYQDWRPKTLRELFVQWQAVMLESWHHTAHIKGTFAGSKVKYSDLHPYISKVITRVKNSVPIKAESLILSELE